MWARISEIVLGIWLLLTPVIFKVEDWAGVYIGPIVILLALMCFYEKINKMHLLQVLPAFWLLYLGYTYPTSTLPFYLQNYILVALTILMFAVIPSNASDHPRPWKRFLERTEDPKK